jgi:hypothetical protein
MRLRSTDPEEAVVTAPRPTVVIVHLSCTVDELVGRLPDVAGARLVRELPPGRAVVTLTAPDDQAALSLLPGVVSVQADTFEHLTRDRD